MSNPAPAYVGQYTYTPLPVSKLESRARKRYLMATQQGKPVLDYELTEAAYRSFDFVKRYLECNVGDAAIGYNSFQIIQSSTTTNNFTIKGGTADNPAILIVKGYPLILFGDIEYNQQNSTGSLEDDDYTTTSIPALTTPGSPRTDTVYVDTYLAEVSSELGSEYRDITIKDVTLALQTANRFRIVQDILVNEGSTSIPVDGLDANSVYHRYFKLAEINRTASASITTAMIVDKRVATATLQDFKFNIGLDNNPPMPSADTIIINRAVAIENDLTVRGTVTIEDITHTHSETLTVSNSTNGVNSATFIKTGTGVAVNIVASTDLQHHMLMSKSIVASDSRWSLGFIDAESGSNTGSNFYISAMNDAGVIQAAAFKIFRNTSYVGVNTVVPIIYSGSTIGISTQYFENMYSDTVSMNILRGKSGIEGGLDTVFVDVNSVIATQKGSGIDNGIRHFELGNELISYPDYPRRWSFNLYNVESGLDSGSDFAIQRFDDMTAEFGVNPIPFVIKRSNGFIGLNNTNPLFDVDVDGQFNSENVTCSYIGVGTTSTSPNVYYRSYIDADGFISGMHVKDNVIIKDVVGGAKLVTLGIEDIAGDFVNHYTLSTAELGSYRWSFGLKNLELNDETGSDLRLIHYDDAGTEQASSLFINRSSGNIGFGTEANYGSYAQFDTRVTIYGDNALRILGENGHEYEMYGGSIYFGAQFSTYISEPSFERLQIAAPEGVKFVSNVGINADPASNVELLVNGTIYLQPWVVIGDDDRTSMISTQSQNHYRHYLMTAGTDSSDSRWSTGLYGTEAGSETGSDYSIWRYDDAGVILSPVVICMQRSTGYVGIHTTNPGADFDVNGSFKATSTYTSTVIATSIRPMTTAEGGTDILTLNATTGPINYSYLAPTGSDFVDRREIVKFNDYWSIGIKNSYFGVGNEGNDLCIWRNSSSVWQDKPAIIIDKDTGYVGMGLPAISWPVYQLDITGSIRTTDSIYATTVDAQYVYPTTIGASTDYCVTSYLTKINVDNLNGKTGGLIHVPAGNIIATENGYNANGHIQIAKDAISKRWSFNLVTAESSDNVGCDLVISNWDNSATPVPLNTGLKIIRKTGAIAERGRGFNIGEWISAPRVTPTCNVGTLDPTSFAEYKYTVIGQTVMINGYVYVLVSGGLPTIIYIDYPYSYKLVDSINFSQPFITTNGSTDWNMNRTGTLFSLGPPKVYSTFMITKRPTAAFSGSQIIPFQFFYETDSIT